MPQSAGSSSLPYWRLSGFYFFYFAQLGAFIPYFTVYLKNKGLGIDDIGLLSAVLMLTKLVAPNLWTWLSSKIGSDSTVFRVGPLLPGVFLVGVFYVSDIWLLAFLLFCYGFFRDAQLPQMEVLTLNHLGTEVNRYGQIRLWGSLGFIVSVVSLGYWFDHVSVSHLSTYLFVTLLAIIVSAFLVPSAPKDHEIAGETVSMRQVIFRKDVLIFLGIGILLQFSHAPYYTFYTLFLEEHGYSKRLAGYLWAIGVLAEIVLFVCVHRLFLRITDYALLTLSVWLTALRWLLIALFPHELSVLIFAQLLHAASYGACHAASMRLLRQYFPNKLEAQGQALYVSVCFGAGGAIGAWYAAYAWTHYSESFTFWAAAIACVVAGLLAMYASNIAAGSNLTGRRA